MPGALEGITVVDLSVWRPGPYATSLLADMGARVVKIEPPGGDPMRAFPELFDSLNHAKETQRVDLKTSEGRAGVLGLAAQADVVVEGFRPGVVDRLGVGYRDVREVNAGIVYCSISGFGQHGPLAPAPGHDVTYLAWAGALSPDGAPPVVPRVPVADLAAGMAAAMKICAACLGRARTGEGAYLDIAMADVVATWTGPTGPRLEGTHGPTRTIPGYGPFAARDGYVALGVLDEDPFWRSLCAELGLEGEAGLTFAERAVRTVELQDSVAAAVRGRGRDELVAALVAAGVPAAPVLTRDEMLAQAHFRERGTVTGPDGAPVVRLPQ